MLGYAVLGAVVFIFQLSFWPWAKFSDRLSRLTELDGDAEELESLVGNENESYWQGV